MFQRFQIGDRVRFHGQHPLLGNMCLGTIQQVYLGAKGFYDVLLDATGEVYLLAEWDLMLVVAPAPLSIPQAREVGAAQSVSARV
jgi:hypothetical protein